MLAHLDLIELIENQQWTTITNRKSKEKSRASSSKNISIRETEEGITPLTSPEEEGSAFATDIGAPSTSKT